MKTKTIFLLTLLLACLSSFTQDDWQSAVQKERDERDAEFADAERSILKEEDLAHFKGLEYFPIQEKYRVKVKVKRIKRGKTFQMKTSTDRLPLYRPYATVTFEIDGEIRTLTVYQNLELIKKPEYEDYLFIPFTDDTSGNECYGGGRYLDLRIAELKLGYIDFNRAYNPYCAYNSKYSCPIPPSENALDISIEAGVKKFHD
ncbi:MAG: DUF1684 domain-containing protein [Flavobacteriales bacterium]